MKSDPFNVRLRAARKSAGLTQRQCCARFNVPRRTWEDWEAGRRVPGGILQNFFLSSIHRTARKPRAIFAGHEFTAKGSTLTIRKVK